MAITPIGGKGNRGGGGATIPDKYIFSGANISACQTARNTYFTTNASEKINGVTVLLKPTTGSNTISMWNGVQSAWLDSTAVIQGDRGVQGVQGIQGEDSFIGEYSSLAELQQDYPIGDPNRFAIVNDTAITGIVSLALWDGSSWNLLQLSQATPTGTSGTPIGFSGSTAARVSLLTNLEWKTKEFLYFDSDLNCLMSYSPDVGQFLQYNGQVVGTTPPSKTPDTGMVWVGTERVYTWDTVSKFWKIVLQNYIKKMQLAVVDTTTDFSISDSAVLRFSRMVDNTYMVNLAQKTGADKYHVAVSKNGVDQGVTSPLLSVGSNSTIIFSLTEGTSYQLSVTTKFTGVQSDVQFVRYGDTIFVGAYSSVVSPSTAFLTMSTTERSYLKLSGNTSTKIVYDVTLNTHLLYRPATGTFIQDNTEEPEADTFPNMGLVDNQVYTSTSTGITYKYILSSDYWKITKSSLKKPNIIKGDTTDGSTNITEWKDSSNTLVGAVDSSGVISFADLKVAPNANAVFNIKDKSGVSKFYFDTTSGIFGVGEGVQPGFYTTIAAYKPCTDGSSGAKIRIKSLNATTDETSTPKLIFEQNTVGNPVEGAGIIFQRTDNGRGKLLFAMNNAATTDTKWLQPSDAKMALSFAGQLSIGTTTPNHDAVLEVVSSIAGVRIPRMNKASRLAIPIYGSALEVYQTDQGEGKYVTKEDSTWVKASNMAYVFAGNTTESNPALDGLLNFSANAVTNCIKLNAGNGQYWLWPGVYSLEAVQTIVDNGAGMNYGFYNYSTSQYFGVEGVACDVTGAEGVSSPASAMLVCTTDTLVGLRCTQDATTSTFGENNWLKIIQLA